MKTLKKTAVLVCLSAFAFGSLFSCSDNADTESTLERRRLVSSSVKSGMTGGVSSETALESRPLSESRSSSLSSAAPSLSSAGPGSSSKTASASKPDTKVMKTFRVNQTFDKQLTYTSPALDLPVKEAGLVRLTVSNPSACRSLTVYFVTDADETFTTSKSVSVTLDTQTGEPKAYTTDLTKCYGYAGRIRKIKVESSVIFDGKLTLQSVEILKGGEMLPNFTVSEKKTVATRAQIEQLFGGASYFPDGLMGVFKNPDGTLDFYGSSPTENGMKSIAGVRGTYDKPLGSLLCKNGTILGTPEGHGFQQFNYASIGQIYSFTEREAFTIIHLEKHFNPKGEFDETGVRAKGNALYTSTLALGYSPDRGQTWYFAGEIGLQSCENVHEYYGIGKAMPSNVSQQSYSRDVGNGPFIVRDGYVYVYMIDCDERYRTGFSVLRAPLEDVIKAARAKSAARQTGLFSKYYNGRFDEPAIKGKFTNIIDDACPANFASILYSPKLKKYVLIRCAAPQYSTHDGDIFMNVSSDPLDFRGRNYTVDAGKKGQQYPTALGKGANPGFEFDKSLCLYYIEYETDGSFIWSNAALVRREIHFD